MNDIGVLVMSCDEYKWLWDGWAYWFKKHWCFDLPWRVHFVAETLPSPVEFATGIQTGKLAWADRVSKALNAAVLANTILYLAEEYWPRSPVDPNLFMGLGRTFQDYEMDCLRVCYKSTVVKCEKTPIVVAGENIHRITPDSPYRFSAQASFWKRDVLLDCLVPGADPWTQEVEGTRRLQGSSHRIYKYHLDWYAQAASHGKWDKRDPFVREYLDALVQ